MNIKIVKDKTHNNKQDEKTNNFTLPEPDGEQKVYITGIVQSSPIEYFTIGGMLFTKNALPVEASMEKNDGVSFDKVYIARKLADNQVEALINELSKRVVHVPARYNPLFEDAGRKIVNVQIDGKLTDQEIPVERYLPAIDITLSDIVIIKTPQSFSMDLVKEAQEKTTDCEV